MSKILILLCLALCVTGCFEIREEVNMKADGSGELQFIVNLSESREKLRQYMSMDKVEGYPVPKKEDIEAKIAETKEILSKVPGISLVTTKSDWSNFTFSLSARFAHVSALNTAINTLGQQMNKQHRKSDERDNFSYNGGQFKRLFGYPIKTEEYNKLGSMQRYVMENARLISIYRFDKSIKGFSNKKAQLSPSGKSIMLQLPMSEMASGKASVANTISF